MRTIITLSLLALVACSQEPPVVNVHVDPADPVVVTNTETITNTETVFVEDTGTIEEPEIGTYYVPDLGNQVWETDTRLEYVDTISYTIPSAVPEAGSDLNCMVVNLRIPADAGQGIIISHVRWGAMGHDPAHNGWVQSMDTVGIGSNVMVLGDLQMFWDPNERIGTELVYSPWEIDPLYSTWRNSLNCPVESCDIYELAQNTSYYVPDGNVSIGFCAAWSADWDNPNAAPNENDWLQAVLGTIWWTPSDTQEFVSESIDGLTLPITSSTPVFF